MSAELVAIDEAAAIPLPTVRALVSSGNRLTFMSSTVNGYEGTGRALSLKLIKELRDRKGREAVDAANSAATSIAGPRAKKSEAKVHEQRWAAASAAGQTTSSSLREIELITPIRYTSNDPVENWLNKLLCLDSGSNAEMKLHGGAPAPSDCELYSVNRDALFSYHKLSESFLQKVMGLYTSAHYKNTPNDLQMLSDAPAHSLFVLLSPSAENSGDIPDILAVIQVALEGKISSKAVEAQLARGHRSAGDMIPWTVCQQFGDSNFAQLSGARIVRVAVHPNVQGMGYGSRAIELLYRFYNGEMISLSSSAEEGEDNEESDASDSDNESGSEDENGDDKGKKNGILSEKLNPRKELPPLLSPLTEVKAPRLDWLGTSFGLTLQLHNFWKRAGMRMLYLRQTRNSLTGEHSTILIRALPKRTGFDDAWLTAFAVDSRRRIMALLGGAFSKMNVRTALSILEDFDNHDVNLNVDEATNKEIMKRGYSSEKISVEELNYILTPHDMKRLELYGRNLCDHHLITDLIPPVAKLYFGKRFGLDFNLSNVQAALICGIGLQNKSIDDLIPELNGLPENQVLAMFNKAVKKISVALNNIVEEHEKKQLLHGEARANAEKQASMMKDVSRQTLDEDTREGAKSAMKSLNKSSNNMNEVKKLPRDIAKSSDIMSYAITGSDEQWEKALSKSNGQSKVQIKVVKEESESSKKRKVDVEDLIAKEVSQAPVAKKKKKSKKSRR